jgi:hypothetical protein
LIELCINIVIIVIYFLTDAIINHINELILSFSNMMEHWSVKVQEIAASVLQLKQTFLNLGGATAAARAPVDTAVTTGINEYNISLNNKLPFSEEVQETATLAQQLTQSSPSLGGAEAAARAPIDTAVTAVTTGDAQVASKAMEKAMQLESVCTVMNTEFNRCLIEIKALAAECTEQKSRAKRLELDVKSFERQLMIKDVTLAEQDMRVQVRYVCCMLC